MSYQGYVFAAYAIFLVAIAWDWIAPKLQIARARREARLRARRDAARKDASTNRAGPGANQDASAKRAVPGASNDGSLP